MHGQQNIQKWGEFNKNLEGCGKIWSLAILRYNTAIFLNGIKKHKWYRDSRLPSQESNPEAPEQDTGEPTTRPSVRSSHFPPYTILFVRPLHIHPLAERDRTCRRDCVTRVFPLAPVSLAHGKGHSFFHASPLRFLHSCLLLLIKYAPSSLPARLKIAIFLYLYIIGLIFPPNIQF